MLELSLGANAIMALGMLILWARAKNKIIEEKLSTFAGCMAAISFGILWDDSERRFDNIALGMSSLLGGGDRIRADMRLYLVRAGYMRMFRDSCIADLGEHLRLCVLQLAGSDDGIGDKVLNYIKFPENDENGAIIEPKDKFGSDVLASAQFVAEKKVLDLYRYQLSSYTIKLFG